MARITLEVNGRAHAVEADPARCSEVEVTFTPLGEERTQVRLEHRHLDRHGEGWENLTFLGTGDGWPLWLSRYRTMVASGDAAGATS